MINFIFKFMSFTFVYFWFKFFLTLLFNVCSKDGVRVYNEFSKHEVSGICCKVFARKKEKKRNMTKCFHLLSPRCLILMHILRIPEWSCKWKNPYKTTAFGSKVLHFLFKNLQKMKKYQFYPTKQIWMGENYVFYFNTFRWSYSYSWIL